MCNSIFIFGKYELTGGLSFELNYQTVPEGLSGVSLTQSGYIIPLLDACDNSEIGTVRFINNTESVLTYPSQYYIIENITINLNINGTLYGNNYFSAKQESYNVGDKIIIPITSCTGTIVGKKGYIVIDVTEDTRYVTIRLDN